MPALSDYVTGTITLTNGQAAFTGANTGWLLAGFKEGDTILDVAGASGRVGVIATITSNTAGTLSKAWEGPTLTNVAYRMRYQPDGARVSAQARNLVEVLGSGNLQSEAQIDGTGGNWLSYFTGAGTKARTALTAKARTLLGMSTNTAILTEIGAQPAGNYLISSNVREKLTSNRTYFVRSNGNDNNTGLADTAAFLTIQRAIQAVSGIDLSGFIVTINVGVGSFAGFILATLTGEGQCNIEGVFNSTTIAGGSGTCVLLNGKQGAWRVTGMTFTTNAFAAVYVANGTLIMGTNSFGSCPNGAHMQAGPGGVITASADWAIAVGAQRHILADSGTFLGEGRTVFVNNAPAFSDAFVQARAGGRVLIGANSFQGGATGRRYDSIENSVVRTYGAGASYLPGSSVGTTATGGVYV